MEIEATNDIELTEEHITDDKDEEAKAMALFRLEEDNKNGKKQ